ncbi:MAG: ATP-binding protein [Promethearchaeota archaeon]
MKIEGSWIGFLDEEKQDRFIIQPDVFVKHLGIFGSTGSGKTVLGKILIEELALQKIPSIVVDPQGDLASLLLRNEDAILIENKVDVDRVEYFYENTVIRVFTPSSNKGETLSLNPVIFPDFALDNIEAIRILDNVSNTLVELLVKLVKYPNSKVMNSKSLIYSILYENWTEKRNIRDLKELTELVVADNVLFQKFMNDSDKERLIISLNNLLIGTTGLLFSGKNKLDIDELLTVRDGKTPINIIFLKSLLNNNEKHLFISILIQSLYSWMIQQGSTSYIKCFFYMDEIAPFMPSGMSSPPGKEMLLLLLRQARKYGVICGVATQSPKDIDYHGLDQLNSLFFGRIITQQSKKVIENLLNSKLPPGKVSDILNQLSLLTSGNFISFIPDLKEDSISNFKTRYLFSKHLTLTEIDVFRYYQSILPAEGGIDEVSNEMDSFEKDVNDGASLDDLAESEIHGMADIVESYYSEKIYEFKNISDEIIDDVILRTVEYDYFERLSGSVDVTLYLDLKSLDQRINIILQKFLLKFNYNFIINEVSRNGMMVIIAENESSSVAFVAMQLKRKVRLGLFGSASSRKELANIRKILDGCLKILKKTVESRD